VFALPPMAGAEAVGTQQSSYDQAASPAKSISAYAFCVLSRTSSFAVLSRFPVPRGDGR
jgi:hypothetical protein